FLAIWFPLKLQITSSRARRIIVLIWIIAITSAVPYYVYFETQIFYQSMPDLIICVEGWPSRQAERLYFLIAHLLLCYLLPLALISFCYVMIWIRVARRSIPGDTRDAAIHQMQQRSKVKVVKMLVVVVIIFMLSWLPLYVIFTRIKLGAELGEQEGAVLALVAPMAQWLGSSNSCINPILYAFFNKKYRNGFLAIVKSRSCCGSLRYDACNYSTTRRSYYPSYRSTVRPEFGGGAAGGAGGGKGAAGGGGGKGAGGGVGVGGNNIYTVEGRGGGAPRTRYHSAHSTSSSTISSTIRSRSALANGLSPALHLADLTPTPHQHHNNTQLEHTQSHNHNTQLEHTHTDHNNTQPQNNHINSQPDDHSNRHTQPEHTHTDHNNRHTQPEHTHTDHNNRHTQPEHTHTDHNNRHTQPEHTHTDHNNRHTQPEHTHTDHNNRHTQPEHTQPEHNNRHTQPEHTHTDHNNRHTQPEHTHTDHNNTKQVPMPTNCGLEGVGIEVIEVDDHNNGYSDPQRTFPNVRKKGRVVVRWRREGVEVMEWRRGGGEVWSGEGVEVRCGVEKGWRRGVERMEEWRGCGEGVEVRCGEEMEEWRRGGGGGVEE
ncbi:hypothetical protein Pcinc_040154, partial [Petrolisthes cinctipes]